VQSFISPAVQETSKPLIAAEVTKTSVGGVAGVKGGVTGELVAEVSEFVCESKHSSIT
jgi:hypothetical protein